MGTEEMMREKTLTKHPYAASENTPAHHLQKITDPTGVVLKIVLENATVNITDKEGHNVAFSAQLVPEVLGTLLDVEKIYYRGLSSVHE